jgi:hypothetical protein
MYCTTPAHVTLYKKLKTYQFKKIPAKQHIGITRLSLATIYNFYASNDKITVNYQLATCLVMPNLWYYHSTSLKVQGKTMKDDNRIAAVWARV